MGIASIGTAVVATGGLAIKSATDVDKAVNQYISSTGTAISESERYQEIMENIYKNNFGDSFEDIADSMALVKKNLGDLSDEQLQSLTEDAFALRDVFDYDISESTRSAKALMDNFAISGEEAFNLIATGAQNGLDYSGEMLDSISEYSVQFAKVGLDAEDMFAIMQKGTETGAWNLDKIGDAVKEMSIRVIDGSETTKQGFETLGLNADEMASKFSQGGETAKQAFDETIKALSNMEDPLLQNQAGVALFGTMWEDLGPQVVTALGDIEEGAYSTKDTLDEINQVKYDDLGSMFEGLKRNVELLLIPLGEMLIPILGDLITAISPIIEEAIPPLSEAIQTLMPFISDLTEMLLPVLVSLFDMLLPPIIKIVDLALPPLLELMQSLLPILMSLLELLTPIIDLFIKLLEPIAQLISQALVPLLQALMPIIDLIVSMLIPYLEVLISVFTSVFNGIVDVIKNNIKIITNNINLLIDFVKNVFTGNWKSAWQNVVDIFKNIVSGIGNIFKMPLNYVIDAINGFTSGLNNIKIPEWVPVVGGKGFFIPRIPRLKVGMDYVPHDYFPVFLDEGERVLTKEENARFNALGGLSGLEQRVFYPIMSYTDENNNTVQIDYSKLLSGIQKIIQNENNSIKIILNDREFGRAVRGVKK